MTAIVIRFVTQYLSLVLFFVLYVVSKFFIHPGAIKRPAEMDFETDIAEIEAETYDDPPPSNMMERFWAWLVCLNTILICDVL